MSNEMRWQPIEGLASHVVQRHDSHAILAVEGKGWPEIIRIEYFDGVVSGLTFYDEFAGRCYTPLLEGNKTIDTLFQEVFSAQDIQPTHFCVLDEPMEDIP